MWSPGHLCLHFWLKIPQQRGKRERWISDGMAVLPTDEPSRTASAMGFLTHTVCSYQHFMLLWSAILIRYVVTCAGNKSSYSTPVLLVHQIPTEMVCMEDHDNHPSGDSIVRPFGLRRRQFSDQISVLGNQNHGWNGLFTRNPTLSFIMLPYCGSRAENWIRKQSVCQNSGCGLQYATFAQHWLTYTHAEMTVWERFLKQSFTARIEARHNRVN